MGSGDCCACISHESHYLCVCVCLSISVFVCVYVCVIERELVSDFTQILRYDLKFANACIVQNLARLKLQKDVDVQSKEIKGLGVSNRGLEDQLSKLLKDTDLEIKAVIVDPKVFTSI